MSGIDELLDEAIAKAKEVGDLQLVEWLRMARGGKSAARWYTAKLRDLEAENAKLRELCRDLFDRLMDKDEHCGECRSQCEHDAWNFGDPKCVYVKRMRELGVKAR